jgi:hypothetical protein
MYYIAPIMKLKENFEDLREESPYRACVTVQFSI